MLARTATLLVVLSLGGCSSVVECAITVRDVFAWSEHEFVHNPQKAIDRFAFALPGEEYRCQHVYYGMNTGSDLVCELTADRDRFFVESLRSFHAEVPNNNMAFRNLNSYFDIKTTCAWVRQ